MTVSTLRYQIPDIFYLAWVVGAVVFGSSWVGGRDLCGVPSITSLCENKAPNGSP